jgi:hypothetical protein
MRRTSLSAKCGLSIAAVLVLVVLYVGAFIGWYALGAYGFMSSDTYLQVDQTLFAPLVWYTNSDFPGTRLIERACDWIYDHSVERGVNR